MSIIDIRVKYGSEYGYSLDWVNRLAENRNSHYLQWLEEKLVEK